MLLSQAEPSDQFSRGQLEDHFCEIILIQENLFEDISYLELCQPLFQQNNYHLCKFGRGHHEDHFCEIILNLEMLKTFVI